MIGRQGIVETAVRCLDDLMRGNNRNALAILSGGDYWIQKLYALNFLCDAWHFWAVMSYYVLHECDIFNPKWPPQRTHAKWIEKMFSLIEYWKALGDYYSTARPNILSWHTSSERNIIIIIIITYINYGNLHRTYTKFHPLANAHSALGKYSTMKSLKHQSGIYCNVLLEYCIVCVPQSNNNTKCTAAMRILLTVLVCQYVCQAYVLIWSAMHVSDGIILIICQHRTDGDMMGLRLYNRIWHDKFMLHCLWLLYV